MCDRVPRPHRRGRRFPGSRFGLIIQGPSALSIRPAPVHRLTPWFDGEPADYAQAH